MSEKPEPEKVAVVGSRGFPDLERVRAFVRSLPPGTTVISGGARGVDRVAEECARERSDLPSPRILHADWDAHGRPAGYLRDHDIINACDWVRVFWDGSSPGTRSTIKLALEARKRIELTIQCGES